MDKEEEVKNGQTVSSCLLEDNHVSENIQSQHCFNVDNIFGDKAFLAALNRHSESLYTLAGGHWVH